MAKSEYPRNRVGLVIDRLLLRRLGVPPKVAEVYVENVDAGVRQRKVREKPANKGDEKAMERAEKLRKELNGN